LSPRGYTYTLSESSDVTGYSAGDWSCSDGGGPEGPAPEFVQAGDQITLGLAENVVCTIVNDDAAAHLTLVKTVTNDNGGTAATTDWTLTASGPTPISGEGGVDSDVSAGAGWGGGTGIGGQGSEG
jgi:hypothetical protein